MAGRIDSSISKDDRDGIDATMGLGILEDKHMEMPPGTSKLSEKFDGNALPGADAAGRPLKKRGDIVLIPQPSDDPNDPLNWSYAWKNSILAILGLSLAITNALGPMLTPGLVLIAKKYHVDHNLADGMMLGLLAFFTGFATFFVASGADIWGKRPFYVIGMGALLGSCIWGYAARVSQVDVLNNEVSLPLQELQFFDCYAGYARYCISAVGMLGCSDCRRPIFRA